MRVFISLNLDDKTRKDVKKYKELLKNSMNRADLNKIKWEAEDKYHITLFFAGEVEEAELVRIYESLETEMELKSGMVEFEFDRISAFPNMRYPRVFYLEVKDEGGKSFGLSKGISEIMGRHGFKQDKKFIPHVTLGRVRNNERVRMNDAKIVCAGEKFSVGEFFVMKSTLSREGAMHEVVYKIELEKK